MTSVLKRARVRQIHFCSRWLRRLSGVPTIFAAIRIARDVPVLREMLVAMTGYRRPFPTLKDAAAAIAGYEGGGHDNPDYHAVKFAHGTKMRPGDYAALFHLERILPRVRHVFDLGGSVGELFYCYLRYLEIPPEFIWTVCDFPETNERGKKIASSLEEPRLRFTDRQSDAQAADLLMISGSLHYLEPLPLLVAELAEKPPYILINRAPVVEGPALATVEDGDTYRLPCIYYNRTELVKGLEALGYELVDSWAIHGRVAVVPCYPDRAAQYWGFFLRFQGMNECRERRNFTAVQRPTGTDG
jgi:putative methyltransferase (TIGR04325 family)